VYPLPNVSNANAPRDKICESPQSAIHTPNNLPILIRYHRETIGIIAYGREFTALKNQNVSREKQISVAFIEDEISKFNANFIGAILGNAEF
jgi:hypothetical protein